MRTPSVARLREEQRGAVSVMAAVIAAALVMATSLAVDVGRVAYTSRDQQGVTDRLALDAVHELGESIPSGATLQDIHDAVSASISDTLTANTDGSSVGTARDRDVTIIEIGYLDESTSEFRPMWDQDGAAAYAGNYPAQPVESVRVRTESFVDFLFGFMDEQGGRDVIKDALVTNRLPDDSQAVAAISVRSRLIDLSTNQSLLAPVVTDLIGAPAELTLAGWDGLATADVPLSVLGDAGADVGSPSQLLASQVTLADLFDAAVAGLGTDDAAVAAEATTALTELSTNVDPALTVTVEDILKLDTENPEAFLDAEFPVIDLVMTGAMAAAIADGDNLVDLSLSGTDVLGLDGLLDVDLQLTLVEAPQFAIGPAEWVPQNDANGNGVIEAGEEAHWATFAETAQVDVDLTVGLNAYYADTLLGPLEGLLSGLLCLTGPLLCPTDTVDISLSAAEAAAHLTDIECLDPHENSDTTLVMNSDALVASVGSGDETIVNTRNGTVNYGVEGEVLNIDTVPGSAVTSDASISGMAILDGVLQPVLGLLGVDAGTAEARTHEIMCDVPTLVSQDLITTP